MTAAIALAAAPFGCNDSTDAPRCAGACIADPAPHCLHPDKSSAGCPGGLVHARATAGAACPGVDEGKTDDCQWRPPPIEAIDTLALIDGFAVPPMEMHVAPPPAPAFAWTAPPDATYVA